MTGPPERTHPPTHEIRVGRAWPLEARLKSMARSRKVLQSAGWVVLSGILFPASLPPFDLGGLAWIALVPLLVVLRGAPGPLAGAGWGTLFGIVCVGIVCAWMPIAAAVGVELGLLRGLVIGVGFIGLHVLGFTIVGAAAVHLARGRIPAWLAAPVAWITLEMFRAWLLGGTEWAFVGHSQHRILWLAQTAEPAGVAGLSAAILLANAAFAEAWTSRAAGAPRRSAFAALGGIVGIAALAGFGAVRVANIEAAGPDPAETGRRTVRVGLVQAAFPQSERFLEDSREPNFRRLLDLSREALVAGAELVVWPETALEWHLDKAPELPARIRALFASAPPPGGQTSERWLVIGAIRTSSAPSSDATPESESSPIFYNSLVLFDSDGRLYDKRAPMAVFESHPEWLTRIPGATRIVRPLLQWAPVDAGPEGGPLALDGLILAPAICSEGLVPAHFSRDEARHADALLSSANDAVLASSAAAAQHAAATLFRAIESRRPLIRIANEGPSFITLASGRRIGAIQGGDGGFAVVDLPIAAEPTRTAANLRVALVAAVTIVWLLGGLGRRR